MSHLPEDINIKELPEYDNIAELLDEERLNIIGGEVVNLYNLDEESRKPWLERYSNSLLLAMQVKENRTWPWPKASNVKFPQMTLAAITFHARAYPSLIPSRDLVNCKVIGSDLLGMKHRRADRVKQYMNYQFLDEIQDWEEEMDRLLITLPITGTEFKKVYYSEDKGHAVVKHVFAKDLVLDYNSKTINGSRKTEILSMSLNEIMEKVNTGVYLDQDLTTPSQPRLDLTTTVGDKIQGLNPPSTARKGPRVILEQHGFYDLDDDGYEEPYIFTVDKDTKKVLRIVARFSPKNVEQSKDVGIIKIVPDEYYIKYSFIPSPDGGIYDIGFGHLVGPLNEATNTLINQLIDAGTLNNLQSGFITKSFRIKAGSSAFEPGEWKVVNATMQDIQKGIYPLPLKEPSKVLLQLLEMLIGTVNQISSTTDIMVGENPGQNQKATTTQAVVENGMRVFTAIYKRLRRALTHEIKHVYKINKEFLDPVKYYTVVDPEEEQAQDFKVLSSDFEDESIDIIPTADPNAVSQFQKMVKAEFLMKMIQFGAPPREVLKRVYDAYEIESPEEVLPPDPSQMPPNPDVVKMQHEMEIEEREVAVKEADQQRKQAETQHEIQTDKVETAHSVHKDNAELSMKQDQQHIDAVKGGMEVASKSIQERNKLNANKNKAK